MSVRRLALPEPHPAAGRDLCAALPATGPAAVCAYDPSVSPSALAKRLCLRACLLFTACSLLPGIWFDQITGAGQIIHADIKKPGQDQKNVGGYTGAAGLILRVDLLRDSNEPGDFLLRQLSFLPEQLNALADIVRIAGREIISFP